MRLVGLRVCMIGLVGLIVSCSSSMHWNKRHPTFPSGSPLGEVGMPDLGDRWIIVRGSWFSDQLLLDPSVVYDTVGTDIREGFTAALQNAIPSLSILPASIIDTFPAPEAVKLDARIYLKGRLPAQGQTILINQFAIRHILLIHELTLGPNLSRENLYDYEKANVEGDARPKKARTVKAIATWTLWDNRAQRPLMSGITEASRPYEAQKGPALRSLIHTVIKELALNLQNDLGGSQP